MVPRITPRRVLSPVSSPDPGGAAFSLVLAGTALAFSPITVDIRLAKTLIFTAFLPPLVFEAAFYMPWPQFRRDAWRSGSL